MAGVDIIVFWLFSATLLSSALMVITMRNPVHAALALVLSFFSGAILWLSLQAEFLAILLILIYVGAVMVLFLFVVMMLDIKLSVLKEGFTRYLPLGLAVALLLASGIVLLLSEAQLPLVSGSGLEADGARQLGHMLFKHNLLPFETAGALLLVAIIAALGINPKQRPRRLIQDPAEQVRSKAKVRLVSGDIDAPLHLKDIAQKTTNIGKDNGQQS